MIRSTIASRHSNRACVTGDGSRAAIFGSTIGFLAVSERVKEHVWAGRLAPDVIVGNSTPVIAALQQATSTIPIVFSVVNDPVGQGFISSLARPGGNITGFTFVEFAMIGKWGGMLRDISPDLSRVALMFNPDTAPYYADYLRSFERMPWSIPVAVSAAPVRNAAETEEVIAKLGREPGSGLIAPPDPFIVAQRDAILRSANKHRVPAVYAYRQFVSEGGLMSYGPDTADIFRRAGSYVDRILRGEKAAELPAQSPVKFELVSICWPQRRSALRCRRHCSRPPTR